MSALSLSAAELAELKLPGLPTTKQGISRRANDEQWPTTWRSGRGGQQRVFPVSALPLSAQQALIRRAASDVAVIEGRAMGSPERDAYVTASEGRRHRAADRVRALEMLSAAAVAGWSAGLAETHVAAELGVSTRTLRRWAKKDGPLDAAPDAAVLLPAKRGPSRGDFRPVHPEAWAIFLGDYLRLAKRSIEACRRDLERDAPRRGWGVIPSADSLARRLAAQVSARTIFVRREGMKKWAELQPSQRRDKSALAPLEWVDGDGHRADLFVLFDDGSIRRPLIAGWQDVFSGKILAWRIAENETTDVIRGSFIDLVRTYGAPENVLVDNGRAYAGKQMAGGLKNRFRGGPAQDEELDGLYKMLGCQVHFTAPYNGRGKPIERVWQEVIENVAKHQDFEGAYTGSNPNLKPENYRSRAVPLAQFRARLEAYIAEHNARPGRQSPVCGGKLSLDQAFASKSYIKRVRSNEQLLYLELPAVRVRVPAKGEAAITPPGLGGARFWHEDLTNILGQEIVLRYHPEDFGRGGYVYLNGSLDIYCRVKVVPGAAFNSADAAKRDKQARAVEKKAVAKAAGLRGARSTSVGPATVPVRHSTKVVAPKFDSGLSIPIEAERSARERARDQEMAELQRREGAAALALLDEEYDLDRVAES